MLRVWKVLLSCVQPSSQPPPLTSFLVFLLRRFKLTHPLGYTNGISIPFTVHTVQLHVCVPVNTKPLSHALIADPKLTESCATRCLKREWWRPNFS